MPDPAAAPVQRLFPDGAETTVGEQMRDFDPVGSAGGRRPYVYTNFALTVDGRATIEGRSESIGSDIDTAMLMALRASADAVLVGAGTMRAERYGRMVPDEGARARREARGLGGDPLAVIVSDSLDLPWDAGLFDCGAGSVLLLTSSSAEVPATSTPVRVERHPDGVDLAAALARLRIERGIRALLCEGGPHLHGELLGAGLVDELFVTVGPRLVGGEGPRLVEGLAERERELELRWLLRSGSELFARYATRSRD